MPPLLRPRPPAGAAGTHLTGAGLVVMWSSGFIGAELGTRHAPADTLLMWRFLAAAALLGAVALVLRLRRQRLRTARQGTQGDGHDEGRLPPRALAEQALIGLLSQGAYLGAVVWAAGLGVPAGSSALIAALQPLVAGALAGRLLGETVTRRQWAGLALGLAGVAAVVRDDLTSASAAPLAYLLPFAGMAGLLAASFLERRARHRVGALDALPVHCLVSAVVFTALAAGAGDGHMTPPVTGAFWLAVAWVVVLSTFGGYGFYWLSLRRSGVTRTSALIYLTPPTTVVWAYAMFGERPGLFAVAGMAVAVLGVVVAVRTPAHARERSRTQPAPTTPPAKEPQSTAARYDRHDGNDSRLEPPAQHCPGGGGGDRTVPPGRLRTAPRRERKGPLR
ncbi:DMT family transporter [Streptomyces abyssalis]|uniref:DMT family transporter n=1 Tax=Streptomyces abyssalis TaxID=933944 RepID=UPI000A647CF4|nr:DMT family transporter [Streptomyces abyssalis]